ncbi:MAG: DciA family protein [Minisyncoccales bacterium]|nr:DciA family protein [Candidatus Pacearchaeota archaeon]
MLQKKFHIENVSLEKDCLLIETKDSVLAQELNFEKETLKEELNKLLGEQKIKEIIIKAV